MSNGILCTVDFSRGSEDAVKWAISLATQLGCALTILYTYRLTKNIEGDVVAYKKKIEREAADKFAKWETELLKPAGIKYKFKIEIGFMADRVEDHAKKNAVSFLVMDRNMSKQNRETFNDLVEHVNVPLVIVP